MNDNLDAALAAKCAGAKKLTAAVRENLAAQTFALATITEAVAGSAALGFDEVVIEPPAPVDLRRTEAVAASAKALVAAGFGVEWKRRQPRPDEPETWLMVVNWRPKT